MTRDERKALRDMLTGEYEIHDRDLTPLAAKAWIRHLDRYSFELVEKAFEANARVNSFLPKPADILKFLPDPLGHPAPEEAWNAIPKSDSEAGFVTDQMARAMGAAWDSIERNDLVAARMAFVESYKREVAHAQTQNIPARFWYSDASELTREQRLLTKEKNILEAAEKRWIEPQRAMKMLTTTCSELEKPLLPFQNRLQNLTNEPLLIETGLPSTTSQSEKISDSIHLIAKSTEITPKPEKKLSNEEKHRGGGDEKNHAG